MRLSIVLHFSSARVRYLAGRVSTVTRTPSDVVIDTPSGQLRGLQVKSCLADSYCAFKGIPYARPPIGSLRFSDPKPIDPWTGIRDARDHGPISLQYDAREKVTKGSEGCLYVNVYTKNLNPSEPAPVMIWIHGGSFLVRSGNDDVFGPDYFMTKDVVLVTFNFRLGVFGFLNLEDEAAPGNQGLKDQVMLLRWVKTHISCFGGDPDNVTVFGLSAGAAAVHFLSISPLSKDLFHKAILQSGSALHLWSMAFEQEKSVRELLKHLGCKKREPKAVVEFLRSVDCEKLIEAQAKLISIRSRFRLAMPFGPGIDSKSDEPFLPAHPWLAGEHAVIRKPLIAGYTSMEGITFLNDLEKLDLVDINRNLERYLHPKLPEFLKHYNCTIRDLRQLYFNDEDITDNNISNFIELLGDVNAVESMHRLIQIQRYNLSNYPVYFYRFSFDKNVGFGKRAIKSRFKDEFKRGASHGDEQAYLFKQKIVESSDMKQLQKGTGAHKVRKQMIELWVNFAKTGSPTPDTSKSIPIHWQPINNDSKFYNYLNIDENLKMGEICINGTQK